MSARPEPEKKQSGLSVQTLMISSASAVAAATLVPMFWERGSILATAVTPIIVAVVSEALRRPADKITQAAPLVTKRSATGAAVRSEQPTGVGSRGGGPEQASRWGGSENDPFGLRQPPKRKRRFPWKAAVITGLVAAVIGGGVVTASELAIFGHQIGNSERSTGLLGGAPRDSGEDEDEQEATPTPTGTEEPTATATPESATPAPTPSPEASVAPLQEEPTATPPPTEVTPIPTPTP